MALTKVTGKGLETLSDGVTITVNDNSDTLTLVSTDADASVGPVLNLYRNSASPADNDVLGQIIFKGEDDAGNSATFARIEATATDVSNGSEDARIDFIAAKDDAFNAALSVVGDKVGIGVTAPTGILSIPAADTTSKPQVRFMSTGATNLADAALSTTDDSGGTNLLIGSNQHYSGGSIARFTTDRSGTAIDFGYTGNMKFFTGAGNAAPTERMRIDSSGNVFIAKTAAAFGTAGHELRANGLAIHTVSGNTVMEINRITNTGLLVAFNADGAAKGSISTDGSSTAYNTSSDYRLKENVDYTWDATTRLKQLKPARFNFIADDTNTPVDGFLAHEVSSIVPEAITGTKDAMTAQVLYAEGDELPDGKSVGDVKEPSVIKPQGIDQSKLVPLLVKTIQELEARITALEA